MYATGSLWVTDLEQVPQVSVSEEAEGPIAFTEILSEVDEGGDFS